ncbi:MAG TPA: GIY-YIG nuclease family protein [Gemmatimonadales bacterium]|nr:GIY-YIG nuclease family protein [Gemmatimonadales bacterium]
MRSDRGFFVYILSSTSRVLYTGVTSDLIRRMHEHREGAISGFTRRYAVHRLVFFERTPNVAAAVAREREIKGWTRAKKVRLIESANAGWIDLAADWFEAFPE